MTLSEYIDSAKLELTGGVLELEMTDETIEKIILKCFKEIQRYIDETALIQLPFASCIDFSGVKYNHVVSIYRSDTTGDGGISGISQVDPMYAQMMVAFGSSGGTIYNLQNYVLNYASYTTLSQMRNTVSTDLAFREDKSTHKIYINTSSGKPKFITIEFVPEFEDVNDIKTEYWQDMLQRMSLAMIKKTLGRIRTRFTLSNSPWQQDGETMLEEGTKELEEIREILRKNNSMFIPVD